MKKLVLMSALALLLLVLTLGNALAMDMEDPVLCVAGEWLTVDAVALGHQSAVTVILPAGTAFGDSAGCLDPKVGVDRITNAAARQGNSPIMRVEVDGTYADPDGVSVSYGDKSFYHANNSKRVLVFQFNLH